MRAFIAFSLAACPLAAQFSNLATDNSGSRVWFSSALRLRGSGESLTPKIFMADSLGRLQLVAQAPPGSPYSILRNPEVSGDGSVLAYTATYNCPPQVTCHPQEYTMGVVYTASGRLTLPGEFHLSRNGRYLAREGYSYFGPTGQFEILDLATQQKRDIPVANFQAIAGGGAQVTSQGSVLAYSNSLWLFGFDGSAQYVPAANFSIPAPGPFFSFSAQAAVDDSGSRVVYRSTDSCEIASTTPSLTAQPADILTSDKPCTMQSLSGTGSAVLFISAANFDGSNPGALAQCWVVDTASKAVSAVTHDAAGIAEATLSGDGNVVWAVTLAGRLLRIDRPSGIVQEIVPRTISVDQDALAFPLVAAPGALVRLTGRGLAARYHSSPAPLATTLDGVQVLADGQPLPLVSVSPADIVFQVPWDMQGMHTLTIAETQSPFEEVLTRTLRVQAAAPAFWYTPDGFPVIAHQDFHGLVSANDPARPDEILHLYLTGLGAVTPPVATGEAAPAAPLSMMVSPVEVFWAGELPANFQTSATVLFAGLAPGLVGLDQVDVQVPHEAPAQLGISVQSGESGSAYATFPVGR